MRHVLFYGRARGQKNGKEDMESELCEQKDIDGPTINMLSGMLGSCLCQSSYLCL